MHICFFKSLLPPPITTRMKQLSKPIHTFLRIKRLLNVVFLSLSLNNQWGIKEPFKFLDVHALNFSIPTDYNFLRGIALSLCYSHPHRKITLQTIITFHKSKRLMIQTYLILKHYMISTHFVVITRWHCIQEKYMSNLKSFPKWFKIHIWIFLLNKTSTPIDIILVIVLVGTIQGHIFPWSHIHWN